MSGAVPLQPPDAHNPIGLGSITPYTEPKTSPAIIPIIIVICISYSLNSLLLARYKEIYGSDAWTHESSIAALTGLVIGGALMAIYGSAIEFDDTIFFYIVLPPIIFSAGISLKRKMFFRYIHLIGLFGVVGTLINFTLITAVTYYAATVFEFRDGGMYKPLNLPWSHAMLLAAVLSGTDEVSALALMPMREYPRLGALIFGEGVLNDAISIVLFHALMMSQKSSSSSSSKGAEVDTSADSMSLGQLALTLVSSVTFEVAVSVLIGVCCGLANARILKTFKIIHNHPIHQTVSIFLFAYLAYAIAEAFDVSGILTLFMAGITQGHYAWYSLSKPAKIATKVTAVALSDIAEGFAFSYVGLSMWNYVEGIHFEFSFLILFIVVVSRLATILTLCGILKYTSKSFKMPVSEQLGFTMGGIVRGCLSWAQILQVGEHRVLVTTTLMIVLITSVGCGFLMPILVPILGLKQPKAPSGSKGDGKGGYQQQQQQHDDDDSDSSHSGSRFPSEDETEGKSANATDDLYEKYSPPPKQFFGSESSWSSSSSSSATAVAGVMSTATIINITGDHDGTTATSGNATVLQRQSHGNRLRREGDLSAFSADRDGDGAAIGSVVVSPHRRNKHYSNNSHQAGIGGGGGIGGKRNRRKKHTDYTPEDESDINDFDGINRDVDEFSDEEIEEQIIAEIEQDRQEQERDHDNESVTVDRCRSYSSDISASAELLRKGSASYDFEHEYDCERAHTVVGVDRGYFLAANSNTSSSGAPSPAITPPRSKLNTTTSSSSSSSSSSSMMGRTGVPSGSNTPGGMLSNSSTSAGVTSPSLSGSALSNVPAIGAVSSFFQAIPGVSTTVALFSPSANTRGPGLSASGGLNNSGYGSISDFDGMRLDGNNSSGKASPMPVSSSAETRNNSRSGASVIAHSLGSPQMNNYPTSNASTGNNSIGGTVSFSWSRLDENYMQPFFGGRTKRRPGTSSKSKK